ncbi:unnamed protein product [Musa textilis]
MLMFRERCIMPFQHSIWYSSKSSRLVCLSISLSLPHLGPINPRKYCPVRKVLLTKLILNWWLPCIAQRDRRLINPKVQRYGLLCLHAKGVSELVQLCGINGL